MKTAEECRAGGKHCARERGAFDLERQESQVERAEPFQRTSLSFSGTVLSLGAYVVPTFKLADIVRWC